MAMPTVMIQPRQWGKTVQMAALTRAYEEGYRAGRKAGQAELFKIAIETDNRIKKLTK